MLFVYFFLSYFSAAALLNTPVSMIGTAEAGLLVVVKSMDGEK